jgi:hypothetical protein
MVHSAIMRRDTRSA